MPPSSRRACAAGSAVHEVGDGGAVSGGGGARRRGRGRARGRSSRPCGEQLVARRRGRDVSTLVTREPPPRPTMAAASATSAYSTMLATGPNASMSLTAGVVASANDSSMGCRNAPSARATLGRLVRTDDEPSAGIAQRPALPQHLVALRASENDRPHRHARGARVSDDHALADLVARRARATASVVPPARSRSRGSRCTSVPPSWSSRRAAASRTRRTRGCRAPRRAEDRGVDRVRLAREPHARLGCARRRSAVRGACR